MTIDFSQMITVEDRQTTLNQRLPSAIDSERDMRINSGFHFRGVKYQSRPEDRENILGAAQLAFQSIVMQLPWPEDYSWIANDNTRVPMSAQDVVEFGATAAQHKQLHIFAASDLKNMKPIPEDFAADAYWPAMIESEGKEGPSQLSGEALRAEQ